MIIMLAAELSAHPASSSSPHGAPPRREGERDEIRPATAAAGGNKQRRRGPWAAALVDHHPRAAAWGWDRAYLLACAAGLVVDPLFLYAVCLSAPLMCVFLDGWFAAAVTALRCAPDAMHAWNLLLRLRETRAPPAAREDVDEEAARPGRPDGTLGVAGAGAGVPERARSSKKGILLDVFVILPVMQVRAPPCPYPSMNDSRALSGTLVPFHLALLCAKKKQFSMNCLIKKSW